MNPYMKLFQMALMIVGLNTLLKAQGTPDIRLRSMNFEEWSKRFVTVDDKGRLLHALHISELKVDSKWCLEKPVRITFNSKEGRILKNAGWFEWHPVRNCWMKTDVPRYIAHKDKSSGGDYIIDVNCPGVYGLFFLSNPGTEGLAFKAPVFHRIKQLQIRQEAPGICVQYSPENPTRTVCIPTSSYTYSTKVSAVIETASGETYAIPETCLGGMIDIGEMEGKNKRHIVNLGRNEFSHLFTKRKSNDPVETELTHNK